MKNIEPNLERTAMLLGVQAVENIKKCHIAVFGVGGVGGYAVEALARSGVGKFDLFDNDTVSVSNINRQIIATFDTVGELKVEVMKNRIKSVNKTAEASANALFVLPETIEKMDFSSYDYVIDAIDTVSSKIALAVKCERENIPLISAMGAGNKLNPCGFEVTDIYKTSVCPLARVMRTELKKRGVKRLKVVYSKEQPLTPLFDETVVDNALCGDTAVEKVFHKRQTPGSVAFVPSVVGLIIAGEVIKDLMRGFDCKKNEQS